MGGTGIILGVALIDVARGSNFFSLATGTIIISSNATVTGTVGTWYLCGSTCFRAAFSVEQGYLSQPIFIHPSTTTRPTSRNNNFETGSSTCECATQLRSELY